MAVRLRRLLPVVVLLVLVPVVAGATVRRSWPTMGTFAEVTLDTGASARARGAIGAVREVFERVNRTMTVYDEHSDLTRVNRWAGFRAVSVDPWLARVVARAKEAQIVTEGAFRITVLGEGIERGLKPPLVNVVPGNYGPGLIAVDPFRSEVYLHDAGMGLDLGGIAKGFALDRAGEVLERRGFDRYLINLGRSLMVGRAPRGETGWPVKLANDDEVRRLSHTVVSTSRQGVRSDTEHIVADGDGSARRWVAVAARTGWVSDMASTALLVEPGLVRRLASQYPGLQWVEVGKITENRKRDTDERGTTPINLPIDDKELNGQDEQD